MRKKVNSLTLIICLSICSCVYPQKPGLSDVQNYKMDAATKIGRYWKYKPKTQNKNIEDAAWIIIIILPSGKIKDITFVEVANDPEVNRSVKEAILKAAPFDPFPQSFNIDQIELGIRATPSGFR